MTNEIIFSAMSRQAGTGMSGRILRGAAIASFAICMAGVLGNEGVARETPFQYGASPAQTAEAGEGDPAGIPRGTSADAGETNHGAYPRGQMAEAGEGNPADVPRGQMAEAGEGDPAQIPRGQMAEAGEGNPADVPGNRHASGEGNPADISTLSSAA